jgi:nitroreductase
MVFVPTSNSTRKGVIMAYFDNYKKPIEQTIRSRVSCRTYQDRLLTEDDKAKLLDFCQVIAHGLNGDKISFHFIEYDAANLKKRKLAGYGLFKNARSFIIGVIKKSDFHSISYGYAVEHLVLKATELGIGSCWMGDFDPYLIKDVPISEKQAIPALCLLGYVAGRRTFIEKTARLALGASKRKAWHKLFFQGDFTTQLVPEMAGPYKEPLELLRLAPSSGNTQPWRIVKNQRRNVFHFFKKVVNKRYETKNLHDIDIGIAMCHFELGALKNKLKGRWLREDPSLVKIPAETHYMISWTPQS